MTWKEFNPTTLVLNEAKITVLITIVFHIMFSIQLLITVLLFFIEYTKSCNTASLSSITEELQI